MKNLLIQRLRAEQCSCVILNHGTTRIFHQKGVKDLHHLLRAEPSFLAGAMIADKVVGKGAAALLVAGGVEWLYAEVISRPALELLNKHNISVEVGSIVPNIINRTGDDICPVEKRCLPCNSIEECLRQIDNFLEGLDHKA
jgi:hypothetical protein